MVLRLASRRNQSGFRGLPCHLGGANGRGLHCRLWATRRKTAARREQVLFVVKCAGSPPYACQSCKQRGAEVSRCRKVAPQAWWKRSVARSRSPVSRQGCTARRSPATSGSWRRCRGGHLQADVKGENPIIREFGDCRWEYKLGGNGTSARTRGFCGVYERYRGRARETWANAGRIATKCARARVREGVHS